MSALLSANREKHYKAATTCVCASAWTLK